MDTEEEVKDNRGNIHTITIFDFDDTLFHSSEHQGEFQPIPELSETVLELLKSAAKKDSQTYIVTNASGSWVDSILQTCLKDILDVFHMFTKVISARDLNTSKEQIFAVLVTRHRPKQLISFGDAPTDRAAALYVEKMFPHVRVKSILTTQTPPLDILIDQHRYIIQHFDAIYNHQLRLDNSIMIGEKYSD
mgnify:CR=1 FL=1